MFVPHSVIIPCHVHVTQLTVTFKQNFNVHCIKTFSHCLFLPSLGCLLIDVLHIFTHPHPRQVNTFDRMSESSHKHHGDVHLTGCQNPTTLIVEMTLCT